jgi:hypothetical protein
MSVFEREYPLADKALESLLAEHSPVRAELEDRGLSFKDMEGREQALAILRGKLESCLDRTGADFLTRVIFDEDKSLTRVIFDESEVLNRNIPWSPPEDGFLTRVIFDEGEVSVSLPSFSLIGAGHNFDAALEDLIGLTRQYCRQYFQSIDRYLQTDRRSILAQVCLFALTPEAEQKDLFLRAHTLPGSGHVCER